MSFVDDLIDRYNDVDRRLGRMERLDVNPPVSSIVTYSGTPVANALAIWSGAGTVTGGSIAYSNAGTPILAATSSAGLMIQDDGGNVGLDIDDGGVTTVGNALIVVPLATGIRTTKLGTTYTYAISPGSITTSQVWTINITIPVGGNNNFGAMVDIFAILMSGATSPSTVRGVYRASTSFFRTTPGSTATIPTPAVHISSNVGLTVAVTAIADGISITFTPSGGTVNRNAATLTICSNLEPTVTSAVA